MGLLSQLPSIRYYTPPPRRWHGDLKFFRAPWDRTKILENIANNFTFSITWRCRGAPTATVAFPRSAHGVPLRSKGVLTGRLAAWSRSAHGVLRDQAANRPRLLGVLVACKELSLRIDGVHTARTARPMRFYGVFTECLRAYKKTSGPGISQKSSHI